MKAESKRTANTLRGTLLLKMAISRTLAKDRDRHPLKAPCLHLSQIGTSIVKKLKERALSLQGKLPAPSILREFCFEILGAGGRSRELLPDISAIYGRRLSESAAETIGR